VFLSAAAPEKGLFSDNQFKLRDKVNDELSVGPDSLQDSVTPIGNRILAPAQDLAD